MAIDIIVKSRIKDFAEVDGKKLNVAAEAAGALSKRVIEMIKEASKRAKLNGRNTLMAKDF